jgi:glycosyltransferase involved in cell wall biosynthesis
MKLVLCLLTYNERACLEQVFPRIPKPSPEAGFDHLVAIDGGSTDGTLDYYRERGVPVIAQSRRGRGDAFLLAFERVEAGGYIFFSPDGNEDASDLPKFRQLLESGADLVIASRMMKGAVNEEDVRLFRPRKWVNNMLNLLANVLFRKTGPYVTDSINGYRAITRSATRQLRLDALDYTIEYQMTIRALKQRMRIVEFPTREGQRVAGESGAPSFPTGIRFLQRLWAELL